MIKPKHSIILLIASVVVLAGVVIGLMVGWIGRDHPATTNGTSDIHATYAALYEAAWRKDNATGNTVMTATLMAPLVQAALAADNQRSQTDAQIWAVVKNLAADRVALVVTYDSTSATMPDKDFTAKLTLTDAQKTKYTPESWAAIIPPTKTTNSASTKSQMGVLTFSAPTTIDWTKLHDLQLVAHNVGGLAIRTFTWAQPTIMTGE